MDKFRTHGIKVGDEVIQVNNIYCEHLGAVAKYVESNRIKNIQLKCQDSGNYYVVVEDVQESEFIHNVPTDVIDNVVTRKKRKCQSCK